jgi:hypothetical protein
MLLATLPLGAVLGALFPSRRSAGRSQPRQGDAARMSARTAQTG